MNKKALLLLFAFPTIMALGTIGPKETKEARAIDYWQTPCQVKVVDETVLNSIIDPRADGNHEKSPGSGTYYKRETYNPKDRQWEGLVTVAVTGNRIWTAWYTGGVKEPDPFNYIAIAYSDDDGQTWVDPYIVIDHEDPEQKGVCCNLPHLYVDNGDLIVQYLSQYLYNVRIENPGAPSINDLVIHDPVLISDIKIHKAPTRLTDEDGKTISVVAYETRVGFTENRGTTYIDVWDETTSKYVHRASLVSPNASHRSWPESQVVELERGKWLVASRIESGTNGGVEIAISNDYGKTWGTYQDNQPEPFIGPGSKGHIMQLSTGHILVVNHDTTSSRSSMCAYLSTDHGQTYPYKLSLDSRNDVSYPSAFEKDGYIYIVWDKGRYTEKELRISKITEQDIIDGEVTSSGSYEKRTINKLNDNYTDIVSIQNAYEKEYVVDVGTPSSRIRNQLPNSFTVIDSKGREHLLTGVWKSAGYKPDVEGKYYFNFVAEMSNYLEDPYHLLRVKVIVKKPEEKKNSDNNNNTALIVGLSVGGAVLAAGAVTGVVIGVKKKKKKA